MKTSSTCSCAVIGTPAAMRPTSGTGIDGPAVIEPSVSSSVGAPSSPGMTTSIARGLRGSRRRKPLRSSTWSWWETEDGEVRPTASPISRIVGG